MALVEENCKIDMPIGGDDTHTGTDRSQADQKLTPNEQTSVLRAQVDAAGDGGARRKNGWVKARRVCQDRGRLQSGDSESAMKDKGAPRPRCPGGPRARERPQGRCALPCAGRGQRWRLRRCRRRKFGGVSQGGWAGAAWGQQGGRRGHAWQPTAAAGPPPPHRWPGCKSRGGARRRWSPG